MIKHFTVTIEIDEDQTGEMSLNDMWVALTELIHIADGIRVCDVKHEAKDQ